MALMSCPECGKEISDAAHSYPHCGFTTEEKTMNEFLKDLLLAVATAAVPVLTAYIIVLVRKMEENAAANTESVMAKIYITEVTEEIAAAVAATNQTYVDTLKNKGQFDAEAQKKAAQKALAACLASISPAAQKFIETAYGDITAYLTTKIEAEVRKQKSTAPFPLSHGMMFGLEATVEEAED